MFDFISQYKTKVISLSEHTPALVRFFYAIGLVDSYVYMVRTFLERAASHPEVVRTPAMFDAMLEHFQTYPLEHISVTENRIFNEDFVGTLHHLEAWQQAGYPLERSEDDHSRRWKVWYHIWNNIPITETVTRTSKKGKTSTYEWTYFPKTPTEPHDDASVEETMAARMENYGPLVRYVPFWLPLNYGTTGVPGSSNPGYPVVEGLHFVNIAEQRIAANTAQSLRLLDRFLAEQLETIEPTALPESAIMWAKSKIQYSDTYDIDTFAIAEKLAHT